MYLFMKEVKELSDVQKKQIEEYASMKAFARLQELRVQDLLGNKNESVIYSKYSKERIIQFLESPQRNEKELRELSVFLYITSPHYRRLIDYLTNIMEYNYSITPTMLKGQYYKDYKKDDYYKAYVEVARQCDKYALKQEGKKIVKTAIREGVFYGLYYETDESFYVKPVNPQYARIANIVDGTFEFAFDLAYFSGKETLLENYGKEFERMYWKYKGKDGKQGDKTLKWYIPKNGICIKVDETDTIYSFPYFLGLLLDLYDIDDYKMIQKAKSENENFKALGLKMKVDDDGVPTMDYDLAVKYYNQVAGNIATGVGVFLSPFDIEEFSFAASSTAERDRVTDAIDKYWYAAAISPLVMGSSKATTSSALLLSVKPDEAIVYSLLEQIARVFNRIIKNMNLPYGFKLEFAHQSIFNGKDYIENQCKGAQYGVSGAKSKYAASLGMNPSDVIGMAFLEDEILGFGTKMFNVPMVSSHTQTSDETGGRPTNESKGEPLDDAGEATKEGDQNANK